MRADLTAPLHTLTFPVLELILITGLCWMGIGWLDQPGQVIDIQLRNGVVLLWALLVLWRFVLPLLRARRRRFMLTDRRIIVRAGTLHLPRRLHPAPRHPRHPTPTQRHLPGDPRPRAAPLLPGRAPGQEASPP
ncbi:hypothetical protein QP028_04160 [Corynebacterium suedekumii]|nr:hypothetical protein QP028_04160 [Corynebacterium suedekumii]